MSKIQKNTLKIKSIFCIIQIFILYYILINRFNNTLIYYVSFIRYKNKIIKFKFNNL
jgi:hypothetical protein